MNVARAICTFLADHGCHTLFGVPGYANSLLFLETRHVTGIKPVLVKHEAAAAWMAYGFAQATGSFGACTATSGPGTTNLLTGIAAAYMNSVPLIALTGQVERAKFGKGAFQELTGRGPRSVDVMRVFDTMTKWNAQLLEPDDLCEVLAQAWDALTTGRKGPVHINIPVDVLRADLSAHTLNALTRIRTTTSGGRSKERSAVDATLAALKSARAPLLLFGKGCHEVRAQARALVHALDIPATTTLQGKGILDASIPLAFGILGTAGSPRANTYLREVCDLVIAIGTSLGEFTLDGFAPDFLMSKRVLRVDIDEREFEKAPFVAQSFAADAGDYLACLLEEVETRVVCADAAAVASWRALEIPLRKPVARDKDRGDAVAPMDVIALLEELCDDHTVFIADSGNAAVWATHYLHLKPGQEFHIDINLASMGSGILSSLGHAFAGTGKRVVCIVGDGAFLMNGIDISTAADHALDVVWLVLNDGKLGMVVQGDSARYGATVASTFVNHDVEKLALACGARSVRITTAEQLRTELTCATIAPSGPVVLDVIVNDDYLPSVYARSQKPVERAQAHELSAS